MALTNGTVTVGTAATQINGPASGNPIFLHIHNNDNTDTMYLGGPAVTTTDGLALTKLDSFEIILRPGNSIYAISTKAGHTLSYLKQDY